MRRCLDEGRLPCEVTSADSVSQALGLLENARFDAIVTELRLRDATGLTVVSTLHDATTIPIVVVGEDDDPDLDQAIDAGAQDFLALSEVSPRSVERALLFAMQPQRSHRHFAQLFHSNPDGIVVVDGQDGTIQFANPAAARLFQSSEEELLGETLGLPLTNVSEIKLRSKADAEIRVVETDWEGRAAFLVTLRDISVRKQLERRLTRLAHHDALTGLVNRTLLLERVAHSIAMSKREHLEFAFMVLDLDRFKSVNDTLGHEAGDQLLREAAVRLQGALRASDTAARWGGDEFVVLAEHVDGEEGAATLAEKINAALLQPYEIRGQQCLISASTGIAMFPRDGNSYEELIAKADSAMYRAKKAGRASFRFFDEGLHSQAQDRLRLEAALRLALKRGELRVVFQPQVSADRLVGVEALVRWNHPQRGTLLPQTFVPILEENGGIAEVERWLMAEAARQVLQWQGNGYRDLRLAVNISARHLVQDDFVGATRDMLEATGFSPEHLELEITEGFLVQDTERALEQLTTLEEMGIGLALDDFGTGYSSLAYLHRFPSIRTLKIDQSFVGGVTLRERDRSIVESVIGLGHSLGLNVVAEGCETREQVQFLAERGCDMFQGFLFAEPCDGIETSRIAPSLTEGLAGLEGIIDRDGEQLELGGFPSH